MSVTCPSPQGRPTRERHVRQIRARSGGHGWGSAGNLGERPLQAQASETTSRRRPLDRHWQCGSRQRKPATAVDSNGDSNRAGRPRPRRATAQRRVQVTDSGIRRRTGLIELTSGGSRGRASCSPNARVSPRSDAESGQATLCDTRRARPAGGASAGIGQRGGGNLTTDAIVIWHRINQVATSKPFPCRTSAAHRAVCSRAPPDPRTAELQTRVRALRLRDSRSRPPSTRASRAAHHPGRQPPSTSDGPCNVATRPAARSHEWRVDGGRDNNTGEPLQDQGVSRASGRRQGV
jgi:hypothetical protein